MEKNTNMKASPRRRRSDSGRELGRAEPGRGRSEAGRTNDPEKTKRNILDVAREEFSSKGLSGARIDEIAARTQTSKRMIYYYFGSKEGLYIAVLEEAYRGIRGIEAQLDLEDMSPEEALRKLVAFTFEYESGNPDFIRLVMNENIHQGEYLKQSKAIRGLNVPAIDAIRKIYERGRAAKVFRPGLDPIDLHMSISALCFFNVANRHTFSTIFDHDMSSPAAQRRRRDTVVEMILRFVKA